MTQNFTTICAMALVSSAITLSPRPAIPEASSARAQDEDDEPVQDGKWLYTRHCSGCHNDNGDGKGATILQLGLTARDFQQGGFAFGDTPEQLFKTITTGIPGRSPMPSFKGVLSEEEIGLVIEHVRTLMPKREDSGPKNTEMIVKDRPVIARGKLPPVAEGAKEVPRGLLIGTPEGMTFEYDLEDVKLLGVRIGRFADREDWGGRGGGYLKPLGQLVWQFGPGLELFGESSRCVRVLERSWCRASDAGIVYAVRDGKADGPLLGVVQETVATVALSVGPGWTLTQKVTQVRRPNGFSCVLPAFGASASEVVEAEVTLPKWSVRDRGELGVDACRMDFVPAEDGSGTWHTTTVRVAKWSEELAAQLEKELSK